MKPKKDIIQELEQLDAQFLLQDTTRKQDMRQEDIQLSEDFYQSILCQLPLEQDENKHAIRKNYFSIFKMAASFALLIALGTFLYQGFSSKSSPDSHPLNELISEASYDEIFDFLYEDIDQGDDFLLDFIEHINL